MFLLHGYSSGPQVQGEGGGRKGAEGGAEAEAGALKAQNREGKGGGGQRQTHTGTEGWMWGARAGAWGDYYSVCWGVPWCGVPVVVEW